MIMKHVVVFALLILLFSICCVRSQHIQESNSELPPNDGAELNESEEPVAETVEIVEPIVSDGIAEHIPASSVTQLGDVQPDSVEYVEPEKIENVADANNAEAEEIVVRSDTDSSVQADQLDAFIENVELDQHDSSNGNNILSTHEEAYEDDSTNTAGFPDPFDYNTVDVENIEKVFYNI